MSRLSVSNFIAARPSTSEYVPSGYRGGWQYLNRLPPFSLYQIVSMLSDHRILFGLWLIKGPIQSKSKFFVECDNPQVKEWLIRNYTRFWLQSSTQALKCVEWGYACAEATWEIRDGLIEYNRLRDIHPLDVRALTRDGDIVGATVKNIPGKAKTVISGPRKLWTVHNREKHPYYGQSRLYGSYLSWVETWSDGGYRDCRRLYFHKYAFNGGTIYHPPGTTKLMDGSDGNPIVISNKDLARELLEKKKTGGTLTLPNILIDNTATRAWEYIPADVTAPPANVLEYGDRLASEIWEGMGIPGEIVEASETGSGYSGRSIPQEAFYATLQDIVNRITLDADEQLFRPAVHFNFGKVHYSIQPFGLITPAEQRAKEMTTNRPAETGGVSSDIMGGGPGSDSNQPGQPGY